MKYKIIEKNHMGQVMASFYQLCNATPVCMK